MDRRRAGASLVRALALGLTTLTLSLGGCSIPLPGMNALSSPEVDYQPTGSIRKTAAPPASPLSPRLDVEDWRRARAALATALDPQGNGSSVAWDNPQSGRRGTFTPVAAPYPVDGQVCRAFIAKIDGSDTKEAIQGSACRVAGTDDWDVKDLKPFRTS